MGAFQSGFQMGGGIVNDAIRNAMLERDLALKEAADARAAEEFGRKKKVWSDTDAALANFNNVAGGIDRTTQQGIQNTYGMTPAQTASALQAGGVSGLQARLSSYDAPDSYDLQSVPAGGLQPRFDPSQIRQVQASPMDMQRALLGLATASGDYNAIAGATDKLNTLQGQQESRDFLLKGKSLFANRNSSPEAMQAWKAWAEPHTQMASRYTGLEADYRVNPKTGVIEEIPYAGGKITERGFDEIAPYMLKTQHLISMFGDPATAADALSKMSTDERARVLADNQIRLGIKDKISGSIHRADTAQSQRISANAAATSAGAAVTNANTNKALRDAQIGEINDRAANKTKALELMDKWDKLSADQQMGPEGDAILREYNMLNVKAGGTVSLGPKPGKGGQGTGLLARGVDQKKNDDGTYTAFDKATGQALYNTINGQAIPLGMDAIAYAGMKSAAKESGVGLRAFEDNGRIVLKYMGADGQPYDDVAKARYAKAPAANAGATTSGATGLRVPGIATSTEITTSVNPQTKQKTYVVPGLRRRFNSLEEAQAAQAASGGGSVMSQSLSRYGD